MSRWSERDERWKARRWDPVRGTWFIPDDPPQRWSSEVQSGMGMLGFAGLLALVALAAPLVHDPRIRSLYVAAFRASQFAHWHLLCAALVAVAAVPGFLVIWSSKRKRARIAAARAVTNKGKG